MVISLVFISPSPSIGSKKKPTKTPNKGPVAIVNGTKLSRAEFNKVLQASNKQRIRVQQKSKQGDSKDSKGGIENEVLENLINRELLHQESLKNKITVSYSDVDKKVKEIKKKFPTEKEYKAMLDRFQMSEADIQKQVEQEIEIQKLLEKKFKKDILVSKKETNAFYDDNPNFFKVPSQVRARHILIKVEKGAKKADKLMAKKKIEKIEKKVKKGGDFEKLANKYSEGPSASKGGDLGFFGRGQMVKPFEEAAFSMKPQEVSDVVETPFGYHLIKVEGKKAESKMAYKDVKDQIQGFLKNNKFQKVIREYINTLRKSADIKRLL